MKVRSWLSTCSNSGCISAAKPPPKPHLYETGSSPDIPTSSSSSSATSTLSQDTTNSSLQSNLSLLTLPSVPSLQKLSPESLNLSVSTSCINSLRPTPSHVNFLAIHNNLLYAASGNEISVFEILNFSIVDTFNREKISSGSIKSLTFCHGKIFTAHQDCKIRVWKLTPNKKHKLVATLPTLEDRLRRFILPQNYVQVRRHKKRLWIEHHDAVSGLAAAEDFVCSVSWDRTLKFWKPSESRCFESVRAHDDAINAVVVSNTGLIYTGSADARIKVWGKPSGEKKHGLIATLEKHKSAVNALALSSDGSVLFSGACDRSILVWEKEDSADHMVVTGALRGHSKAILCLINISDLLFSGSADRTVRIWQRGVDCRYCCLTVLAGHEKPVRSLAAVQSDGGFKVFSGSFDGEIKVWQVVVSCAKIP